MMDLFREEILESADNKESLKGHHKGITAQWAAVGDYIAGPHKNEKTGEFQYDW